MTALNLCLDEAQSSCKLVLCLRPPKEPVINIDLNAYFKRSPEAVFSELEGEIALFQSKTSDYLILNDEGSAIWNALSQPKSLDEICTHLVSIYAVETDQCRQDVQAWLNQACEKHVVVLVP
jgi:hypothetical protein